MLQTKAELQDKIRAGTNPEAIPKWQQAIRIIDGEIEKYYPQKVKEVA